MTFSLPHVFLFCSNFHFFIHIILRVLINQSEVVRNFHTRVQLFSLANFNRTREQFFVLVAAIVYAHQPGLCEAWH